MPNDIEKARIFVRSVASGDADAAMRQLHPTRYIEHDPRMARGRDGVRAFVERVAAESSRLDVVRVLQDGDAVVVQSHGDLLGRRDIFDVFRFEDGLVAEHWAFTAEAGPPNLSGHTQIDGPIEPKDLGETEKNKELVREYYETVHISGRHDSIPRYFSGDFCIRHEPGVIDGVAAFTRDLKVLVRDRTIDAIGLLLGQGDFVFLVGKGAHEGEPCHYVDLYRVEAGKLVEHWGFPERVVD